MKLLRWFAGRLFPLAMVVLINGIVLRITVRDSVDLLAPLYYATPWPVLAALMLPLVWRVRREPQMVFGTIILAHVFLGMWIMQDWRSGEPSREQADLRVLLWNVSRPVSRFGAIEKRVRAIDADIVALAEVLTRRGEGGERWRGTFADYKVEFAAGNMLCLVRGEVMARESGVLTYGSYYSRLDVRVKGRDLRILQADVSGVLTHSRREPLARLAQIADSLRDRPLIVLGDFNTPRSSVHLAPLRKNFVNTFEAAGIGSGETWPMPLPVLSLDQIWCNSALVPVRSRHEVSFLSDHRAIVAELRLSE